MKNSNLRINEKCMQCGSCLGFGFPFLAENDDGTVFVIPGTFLNSRSDEYKELVEICPVGAFELFSDLDKDAILKNLIKQLEDFPLLPVPTRDTFRFNKDDYHVPIPRASGEFDFNHRSYEAANRAALNEFERRMFSQKDVIILKIITDYRIKMVKPYYTFEIDEDSVYAVHNKKLEDILIGIKNILGARLPKDFADVKIKPDKYFEEACKMLNKGEILSTELVSYVEQKFDYSASSYACYWDIGDMEKIVGEDWRGNLKFRSMYCYRGMFKAFKELAKDIIDACFYAEYELADVAIYRVSGLVEDYNKMIASIIKKKLELVYRHCVVNL